MDKKILKEKLDALREKEGQLINHIEAMHTKPSHLVRRDRVYTLIKKNAAWRLHDGTMGVTENPMVDVELERVNEFTRLMEVNHGDKVKTWNDYLPFYIKSKRRRYNTQGGVSFLNGQPQNIEMWQQKEFDRNTLVQLFLFTDGLVKIEDTRNSKKFAQKLFSLHDSGGAQAIIRDTRTFSDEESKTMHIKAPEASLIEITF